MNQTFDIPLTETISFDGKRDTTLKIEKIGSKSYGRKVNEEHVSIVIEPGSQYTGHFTPETGSAKNISTGLINCFKNNRDDLNNLIAVGCDGTAANTGVKGKKIYL